MAPDHSAPPAPLRLRIDRLALANNWRALDRLSLAARAGAAVKANGYGIGARIVTAALAEAGCEDFFVAHWQEAAEIVDLAAPGAIAVLHGPVTAADAHWARAHGVRPVINSLHQAHLWQETGGGPCHLMVDTGINRLGVPMADLGDPLLAGLDVDILLSHLASADEADSPLNAAQQRRWTEARGQVTCRQASLANSAGIALGAAYHGQVTRPGLALYGGVPCAPLAPHIRRVVQPQTMILQVRKLAPGDSVGYNATFTATRPMRVGVVSVGYADGFLRTWSGRGSARFGDLALPVLGRVSMDMTVIDLGSSAAREGDWVDIDYDLPDAAAASGLSQYELLTLLGGRWTRE